MSLFPAVIPSGPGGGTACDALATLPTAFLAGNEQLFVAGREPMSFSSLPRSHQTLNLHTTTSLRPRPVQTIHSATSQDAGPQRANTIIPTWGHRHHSCCFQTSRVRGQKQEKSCLARIRSWYELICPGGEFAPEFAPGEKVKFTFKSLQTRKQFQQLETLQPKTGTGPRLPALAIYRALLASGCNLEH